MAELNMRLINSAVVVAAGLALGGCFSGGDGGTPRNERFENPPGTTTVPPPATAFRPLFAVTGCAAGATGACLLPWPTDLFYAGTTDGTLNIPSTAYALSTTATLAAMNNQDGWSTTSPMTVRFDDGQIDAASLSAANIRIVELYLSNTTKAPASGAELPAGVPSPVRRVLVPGTDYVASVATELDTNGATMYITPSKPLTPSSGATNIGYLVLLTNGIKSKTGVAATADREFAQIQAAPADCSTITNTMLNGVCRLTKAHLQIAAGVGLTPANVVMTFSFSTQSIGDSLTVMIATTPAQVVRAQPTGLTITQASGGRIPGPNANVWVGELSVPYYSPAPSAGSPTAPLTSRWQGNPSPVDATGASREITRFNPKPVKVSDRLIPALITVPNASSPAFGAGKPAAGWPVVIFMPGFTSDRTTMLAIGNSYANAGFVVVSIDHPLHGLTDPANPLFVPQDPTTNRGERTFNVDYLNNATLAPGPDGKIDPSGVNAFGLLLQNPLGFRDLVRQSAHDIAILAKSVSGLDLSGDGVGDIDGSRIHLAGISGGAIVGLVTAAQDVPIKSAFSSVPGGKTMELFLNSASYGSIFKNAVAAQGILPGTTLYQQFFRDIQASIDSSDTWNYIKAATAARPVVLTQVLNDNTVPNSATQYLVSGGGFVKASAAGITPVAAGAPRWVFFLSGAHTSLLDPTASLAVTTEMQTHAVSFVSTGGAAFQIVNSALLQP